MMPAPGLLLGVALAGLVGSIPFSYLIARFVRGIDLRQHGSGNVGATNVARTLGAGWGMLALACDISKGILPPLVLPWVMQAGDISLIHERVLYGVCAVLGHMFSPWLGFRGGKGVATALGVVSVIAPIAMACSALSFGLVFGVSRIVSLSSIVAAGVFAIAEIMLLGESLWSADRWGLGVFTVAVPLLILVRHRANIVRLCRGEEAALTLGRPVATPPASGDE